MRILVSSLMLTAALAAPAKGTTVPAATGGLHGYGIQNPSIIRTDYVAARVSSESRPTNEDWITLGAGETTTIAKLAGPGEITHLWTTMDAADEFHLRNVVIRIYYNENSFPSVEAPIGDFYGLGHGKYYYFSNPMQAIGTDKGMNCFWPMPFSQSARVEITNEGTLPVWKFYYYIDWRRLKQLSPAVGYFHAQYRQAFPCKNGENYLILDTEGATGQFIGGHLSIHTQTEGWWGEGDDIFTVDGEASPSIWGTGSEDYYSGAWGFGATFYNDYFGMPLRIRIDHGPDNYWNVYRYHFENPITFQKSLRFEMEHGASGFDNTRADGHNNDYSSVAYWYAAEPLSLKGKLPPAPDRIPSYRVPPEENGAGDPVAEARPAQQDTATTAAEPANTDEPAVQRPPVVIVDGGYRPDRVHIAPGQPKQIVFDRRDEGPCTDEVVFPELNLRVKLPPGERTVVDLPTTATGELKFRCGMDMLHGTVHIDK